MLNSKWLGFHFHGLSSQSNPREEIRLSNPNTWKEENKWLVYEIKNHDWKLYQRQKPFEFVFCKTMGMKLKDWKKNDLISIRRMKSWFQNSITYLYLQFAHCKPRPCKRKYLESRFSKQTKIRNLSNRRLSSFGKNIDIETRESKNQRTKTYSNREFASMSVEFFGFCFVQKSSIANRPSSKLSRRMSKLSKWKRLDTVAETTLSWDMSITNCQSLSLESKSLNLHHLQCKPVRSWTILKLRANLRKTSITV